MRMILCAMVAMLGVAIAGCSYEPARISTEPAVIIDDGGHGGGGDFCPPGQAKKGRC
ncbi:hypothetical protein [Halomonas elongata]|uniref:hypothetical protein n=1 Tax=Halomonas elongata TaxID=2746 RepID=UPI00166FC2B9|nr:hypothetical protein [Halomonas elongata]MBW5799012.1 hypothetical protein [Halomonas elongata]MDL4864517.1 hypothetical protein [Halomonas elongata]WVI72999.1 hypothetical protein VO226_07070 [Halomonas elongata]